MNDKLRIRDANSGELKKISHILRDSYIEYKKIFPPEAWQYYINDVMDVWSREEDSELIVAEINGTLVGTVTLYLDASAENMWPDGWAGIRLLAVLPAYRGRGIGRALMDECIRRCEERGVKVVGLHTIDPMKSALSIYEKMGFVRVPEYDFQPPSPHVVKAYKLELKK